MYAWGGPQEWRGRPGTHTVNGKSTGSPPERSDDLRAGVPADVLQIGADDLLQTVGAHVLSDDAAQTLDAYPEPGSI